MTQVSDPVICLAGKNQISVDALRFMIDQGWHDNLVVCPNRTDSGVSTWQPSLIRFARELGIEIVTLEQAQDIDDLIFLSLEFDRLVRPSAFRSQRLYNIHFSALPAYKGMYTSALPILNGAEISGVTLHEIDHGIDTGAIIAQQTFSLSSEWTARDLYFTYMRHGFDLFLKHFDALVSDRPPVSTAQPSAGSTYYSKASIDYANIQIDLKNTANGIIRQLRAFSFREYQSPVVDGMEIGGWTILPDRSTASPGSILTRDEDSIVIATIDYSLRLERSTWRDWFAFDASDDAAALDRRHIDTSDAMGWTPLIRACYAGDRDLCQRLLDAGADPNVANRNGTTPLMYAYSGADPENGKAVASMLLASGADPERRDQFGRNLRDYHPEAYPLPIEGGQPASPTSQRA